MPSEIADSGTYLKGLPERDPAEDLIGLVSIVEERNHKTFCAKLEEIYGTELVFSFRSGIKWVVKRRSILSIKPLLYQPQHGQPEAI